MMTLGTLLLQLQLLLTLLLLLQRAPGASPCASQGGSGVDPRCLSLECAHVQEVADVLQQACALVLHSQSVERSSSWRQCAQDDLGELPVDEH